MRPRLTWLQGKDQSRAPSINSYSSSAHPAEHHTTRIDELTAALTPLQSRTPPSFDTWSIVDVLAHLRACSDVWGDCIATILAQATPTLRAIDPRTWIQHTDYREQAFRLSLQAYVDQRTELVAVLQSLGLADWSRTATVTGAGKVLVRSVEFYAQWLARHERSHLKQIERIVKMTV